ncbi:hypothetical protein NA57DRAFT_79230 [Rhizodiscina lignyota]|uniref:Uncharacterized protein n=1 Tax=Rhizodiscina lignyota TaxID=1504668 RepID=A0A9P4I8N5_9PEZI|nr:hypothetical protein NA57DRAFT_79230 [Rhizodiscina lignyota]
MGLNYYASSAPTLVLTPSQQTTYFGNHYQDHQPNDTITNAAAFAGLPSSTTMTDLSTSSTSLAATTTSTTTNRKPMRPRFPKPPSMNYLASASASAPLSGRKRSIADVNADEPHADADGSYVSPTSQPPSPPKPRGEPVYGPGMTLIYPDDPGFSIAAESQTGTWAEEKNEHVETAAIEAMSRPPVISRKSQRLIEPSGIAIDIAITPLNGTSINHVNGNSPSTDGPIDHLSLVLGVGWKRIPCSQAPAAKGWEKYILNHYENILDPAILLHNEGLRAYLVRTLSTASDTQECWWVFQDDLSVCRLVGFCEADAIRNLQKGETMGPTIPAKPVSRHATLNGTEQVAVSHMPMAVPVAASGNGDVEMEM